MKKGLLPVVVLLLAWSDTGFAQSQFVPIPGSSMVEPPVSFGDGPRNFPRGWVGVEYLHWWMKDAPIGVPLVTTGDPASATAGALGDPSTRVLFGNSSVNLGGFNGARLSAGYWFDAESRLGVEGSGFLFARRSTTFNAASDAAGNPFLALPFQNLAGVESAQIVSSTVPFPRAGSIAITSTSRLWGADFNGVLNLYRGCNLSIEVLAGFRYFDLSEGLQIDSNTKFTVPAFGVIAVFPAVDVASAAFDSFSTRNQFYGGQIGARGSYHVNRFSVDVLGKLAIGTTQQTLNTAGSTTTLVNGLPVTTPPGGVYTRASNIGTFHTNSFSVVPQVQLKLGYDITSHVRATIGYDAMYWTHVIRPGDQIDHVVGTGLPGETRPAPMSNRSNFWAHGFNAGLEYRW